MLLSRRGRPYRGQTSVGDVIGQVEEDKEPDLVVRESLPDLIPFDLVIDSTRLVKLYSFHSLGSLLFGEEPSGGWAVWE